MLHPNRFQNYRLSDYLCFHARFRGGNYLRDGWSAAEPHSRWSVGHRATMQFRLAAKPCGDAVVRVYCAAYLAGGRFERQLVDVYWDGHQVATWNVRGHAWHEARVPARLLGEGTATLKFLIGAPMAPAALGDGADTRKLGMDVHWLVIEDQVDVDDPAVAWIGAGKDVIGDVFTYVGGYYRAVRSEASAMVTMLIERGIYGGLAQLHLMPKINFRAIAHPRYAHVASSATGTYFSPSNYPVAMFKDAACNWLSINEELLAAGFPQDYGLGDGHYGNFVQVDNARPVWCDIGSIISDEAGIRFGYEQFVRCFVKALVMFALRDSAKVDVRKLILENPQGVPDPLANELFGEGLARWDIPQTYAPGERREALARTRALIDSIDADVTKGFWADYRRVDALEAAWNGDLLGPGHDSRFGAVMGLIRRANTCSFLDIGCNDGIFSLLCLREGMRGIAVDTDEFALNKLYGFVKEQPAIELCVAHGSFMDLVYEADLVLALALTHHLFLGQGVSFEDISRRFDEMGSVVITEFMPDGLGGTPVHPEPSPNPMPAGYTLDHFLDALRPYYKRVEVINYTRETHTSSYSRRTLIYCSGRYRNHR